MGLYVPYLRTLFQLSVLHLNDLAVALVLGSISITWFEVLKLVRRLDQALLNYLYSE